MTIIGMESNFTTLETFFFPYWREMYFFFFFCLWELFIPLPPPSSSTVFSQFPVCGVFQLVLFAFSIPCLNEINLGTEQQQGRGASAGSTD